MKKFFKYVITYIIMVIISFASLYLSVLFIPKEKIKDNVKKSAEILVNEGEIKEKYYLRKKIDRKQFY